MRRVTTRFAVVSVVLAFALLTSERIFSAPAALQKKVSLDEARTRLEKAKSPVDRARAYIQISDIVLRELSVSVSAHDFDALNEWSEQYREAISSARETMVTSGRDPQRD